MTKIKNCYFLQPTRYNNQAFSSAYHQ